MHGVGLTEGDRDAGGTYMLAAGMVEADTSGSSRCDRGAAHHHTVFQGSNSPAAFCHCSQRFHCTLV